MIAAVICGACSAPSPTQSAPATRYAGGSLIIDNRGAPAFRVVINGSVYATVPCKGQTSLGTGIEAPPLPWNLAIIRVADGKVLLTEFVDSLPKWLVAFDSESPMYLGGPVLGPVGPTCPPGEVTLPT